MLDGAAAVEGKVADVADAYPVTAVFFHVGGRRLGGEVARVGRVDTKSARPVGRSPLAPLGHELDARFRQVGVGELLEEPPLRWVIDDRFPFAFIVVNERLQSGTPARRRYRADR